MSHKPIAVLSGASLVGGISAYARYGSIPSIVGSFAIGSIMAASSMRIRDGMDYGLEGAAVSSGVLMVPAFRRALRTRTIIPSVLALLATTSTAYYTKAILERHP
ncbi:hypothetical protein M231_00097 [Tremella mesenterica]|uniref:Transmembrane protein 14C n=1 Tax=Tremella mesenterica TaxID=5217 RepID=A0A4Q1BWI9_TREME|nr:uncharacterized protein TREMEDRAFT_59008 [Tremella mesenterica DSM 1558]EIW72840.1 hypothetical protein TREMEDRAFT_59008 [Tremella mesenterica DSM 1558]RXK42543.1 hypothetical protein M231_00097 [Tremella mesenterica]